MAIESIRNEQNLKLQRQARYDQQQRLAVKQKGYSQRVLDARNSMNKVMLRKPQGGSR
jgi:hypothetical protein